ncbi:hypothetical protein ACLOJK_036676 [Asimina triloba]
MRPDGALLDRSSAAGGSRWRRVVAGRLRVYSLASEKMRTDVVGSWPSLTVDGLDVAGWIGLWPWASMSWAMVASPMEKSDDGDGADRC